MKKGFLMLLAGICFACSNKNDVSTINLNQNWEFRQANKQEWMTAKVPGTVHADLAAHGLIKNYFFRLNELENFWVEREDWEYKTRFTLPAEILDKDNISIHFKGLDTYARVYLNDSLLFEADNMFTDWQADIKKFLHKGENELRVYFASPVVTGEEKLQKYDYIIMAANEIAPDSLRSNVMTRKAPFHYGWDWGPRVVTSGIWRDVMIHAWNHARITNLYLKPVDIAKEKASYKAIAEIDVHNPGAYQFKLSIDGKETAFELNMELNKGKNTIELPFHIENPDFWWTHNLGEQPLYTIKLGMEKDQVNQHEITDRLGVRTIELVQEPDSIGHSFLFKLNGVPVFMKGANYIPNEVTTPSITDETYERVIKDALDANMNMLRVWGGAIYEDDIFYDLCDENGILVWQDFMFACAMMPPDESHVKNIKKEAEYNIKRLRNHPSIALWCGNNENLRAWFTWGWKEMYTPGQQKALWNTYEQIFCETLPECVNRLHPEISYWPCSPSSLGDTLTKNPACNTIVNRRSGDEHDWSIWFGQEPFETYKYNVPRFVSEYGLQAFPEMKTVFTFANKEDLGLHSEVMDHRQRSKMDFIREGMNGNDMIKQYIGYYYKEPVDFESLVYLSQLAQAEGLKMAIESHRKAMPHCMGTLYWQINDCWPTMSWATVDYFGNWKAGHYFVKKAFKDIIVVPVLEEDEVLVYIVSDKLEEQTLDLQIILSDFIGKAVFEKESQVKVAPNSSKIHVRIPVEKLLGKYKKEKVLFATRLKKEEKIISSNNLYFALPKAIDLPNPVIFKEIKEQGDQFEIVLSVNKLARNIQLTSKVNGFFSDNYFDLIPGESKTVVFTPEGPVKELDKQLVIRSLFDSYQGHF